MPWWWVEPIEVGFPSLDAAWQHAREVYRSLRLTETKGAPRAHEHAEGAKRAHGADISEQLSTTPDSSGGCVIRPLTRRNGV